MNDWWLKIDRAKKHMVDINQEAMRYAESHPYSLTRLRLHDSQHEIRGVFHITQQPNPMIAIMLGDFIHNLRSALDWVVVACVPRKRRYDAGFPIFLEDIFSNDSGGNFVVNSSKQRNKFNSMLDGIHPKARAFIIDCQPYRHGVNSHLDIVGLISRLENADKHRQIIAIGCGGRDFRVSFSIRGIDKQFPFLQPIGVDTNVIYDNTVIPYRLPDSGVEHPNGSFVKPSEMDMHLIGTAKILVKIARMGSNKSPDTFLIESIMNKSLSDVSEIIRYLEFFITSK
jgi:hypothetical protein